MKYLIPILLLLALVAGCASIGNPSGGPRDEQPPRFLSGNPAPGSVNVSNKIEKIKLDFDEIINVKDAMSRVVVSPPSTSIPRVATQGRSVNITFRDTLLPNTTYTIDFANAIEDNNEANPLENFSYSFSTGPDIDSLRISGIVANALTLEPLQQKLVAAYAVDSTQKTVDRIDSIPERIAKTDERGRFSIEGLAPGQYRLIAIDDTDNSYTYNNPEEEFAFSTQIITPYAEQSLTTDTLYNLKKGLVDTIVERSRTIFYPNNILLRSYLTSRKQQFVSKYERLDSTRISLIFNAPMTQMPDLSIIGAPNLKNWYIPEHSEHFDTITLWLKNRSLISTDTLRLHIGYEKLDSLQQYVATSDTLRFTTQRSKDNGKTKSSLKKASKKLKEKASGDSGNNAEKGDAKKEEDEEEETEPVKLLQVNFLGGSSHEVYEPLRFTLETPATRLDTILFRLEQKVDTLWQPLPKILSGQAKRLILSLPDSLQPADWQKRPVLYADTLNPRLISIDYPWKYGSDYRLLADSLAIEGIYGLWSGKIENEFRTKAEQEYSALPLRLADWPAELPAFVELLSASDTPVKRGVVENGKVTFTNLAPAKYYLRIINDRNSDGIWTPGDVYENRLPEESYYYPKAINIKKNWQKEETWRIFDTPVDEMKPQAILKNKPAQRKNQPKRPNSQSPLEEDEEED